MKEDSPQAEPLRVLIVDDDPQVVALLLEIVRAEGYRAESASGARAAIRMLGAFQPHVVVTDLVMPEGEGMELILHLARHDRGPAIVAMSGNPTGKLFLRASELLGVRATLHKPFRPQELQTVLRKLCSRADT